MTAGIPAQDEYPDWLQMAPVQDGEPAPVESKSVRRRRTVQEDVPEPVEEAPVVEEPAADEAAE